MCHMPPSRSSANTVAWGRPHALWLRHKGRAAIGRSDAYGRASSLRRLRSAVTPYATASSERPGSWRIQHLGRTFSLRPKRVRAEEKSAITEPSHQSVDYGSRVVLSKQILVLGDSIETQAKNNDGVDGLT